MTDRREWTEAQWRDALDPEAFQVL